METQNNPPLPAALQAIIENRTGKREGKPLILSGQVAKELESHVMTALSQGLSATQVLNTALAALFMPAPKRGKTKKPQSL